MSSNYTDDSLSFGRDVHTAFAFLEQKGGMTFIGAREIRGDPKDSGYVASYKGDNCKIDIGWSKSEQSMTVLVHLKRDELPRHSRHVYLESFVEYISGGIEKHIVAQIYPQMSEGAVIDAMKMRQDLFEQRTPSEILVELSAKLRRYLDRIVNASSDEIQFYHRWLERPRP